MALALRILEGGPQLIQRAATQTLMWEIGAEISRERISIDSGTVALYSPSGEVLLAASALTPSTSIPGQATYSLAAATVPTTLALGEGYRLVLVLVVAGMTYTLERDACLCRLVPSPTVTAEDLYARHPDLRGRVPQQQQSAGLGWGPQIDAAWREITERLRGRGRRHELVWSHGSLHDVHLTRTLELIYTGGITLLGGDRQADLAQRYRDQHIAAWDQLQFHYDPEDTGNMGQTQAAEGVVIAHAGPRRGAWVRSAWGQT